MADRRKRQGKKAGRPATPVTSLVAPALTPGPLIETKRSRDPGDATQRNFRYQHSYCVALLVAARLGRLEYTVIWCEHHEDVLCRRTDHRFDAHQIKTSRPELGPWNLGDADLVRVIGRFVDLVAEFGDSIANVYFVSNTECDSVTPESGDQRRRARCPQLFLEHMRACGRPTEIQPPFLEAFNDLCGACGCSTDLLLSVLKRSAADNRPCRRSDHRDAVFLA